MAIGGISGGSPYTAFSPYGSSAVGTDGNNTAYGTVIGKPGRAGADQAGATGLGRGRDASSGRLPEDAGAGRKTTDGADGPDSAEAAQDKDSVKKPGRRSSPEDCQTCKNRKYQDGSDENVSFKSAAHISPQAAGAAVRAHEQEHVSNAYDKAAQEDGKVISAAVSIHTSVCPECGRTYVSGGTTRTTIQYSDESNPYQQNQKALDALQLRGRNIDYAA